MAFEIPHGLMVSVSGVRGRVGEALTPEIVTRFAAAFGAFLHESASGRPRAVIARDSRTSGPMFVRAATAGLQSVGCDVIDAGLVPTPTTLFAVRHQRAQGGVVVTASHNPVEWNALKLASASGSWDRLGVVTTDDGALQRHLHAVLALPFLDLAGLRQRRFKVALDCVHGAGSRLLQPLLEALGCSVVGIGLEPDGRFPREPEPVAANLGELEKLVRMSKADIGIATDPDADRLSLVSNTGRAIGEDFTLALAAKLVLKHRPGPVVTNLSTSRLLEDVASAAAQPLYRSAVGEINVARKMQEVGAVVGGEGNGGVILPDIHLTRDSAVATALVLQLLLESSGTVQDLVDAQHTYTIVKDKLPRDAGSLESAYATLTERLTAPATDRQDGLRLDWPAERRWLHLRPSGTEPILRIIAEAQTESSARELIELAREALAVKR
jgi:phosphomannomutase